MADTPHRAEAAQQLEDEAACTRLCVDFANHIDARRYGPLLDLFAEDGTLDRMGKVMAGRAEIARFLDGRPAEVATRHLCANIRVQFEAEDRASGFCNVLFFQGADGGAGVPRISGAPSIVEYHDSYRRTPGGWRIQARRIRMAMQA